MRLTFRSKLVVSHLVVALVAALVAALILELALGGELEQQIDQRLEAQARGVSEWLQRARHMNRLAGRLAEVVGAEVTIFDDDGRPRGDSLRNTRSPEELEGAASSPEVLAAREGDVGKATRYSPAREQKIRYVAVPGPNGLVVRVGLPTATIEETRSELRPKLLLAAGLSLLLALVLATVLARALSVRLARLREFALRIGRREYDRSPPRVTDDEFGVLAEALARSAEELRRLDTLRREFVSNAAHELRTPVTSIRGYAETLATTDVDDATRAEFLETIHRNSLRIAKLVDELLQLQEIEARRVARRPVVPVAVAGVVSRVEATVRGMLEERNASLTVDVSPDHLVAGDDDYVERILQNLVENAIKYGGEEVEVALSCARDGDNIAITVRDSGPGIPEEALPRLFERFYRVDSGRARAQGGSGLGLAIVRELAEALGGAATVRSEPGEGTTFTVTLPAADESLPTE